MPLPQYSPWQEASAGVNRLGNTMQDLMLEVARQRAMQGYQQQRLGMQQQNLAQQESLRRAQEQHLAAQAARQNAAGAIDVEKLAGAQRFGNAMSRSVPTVNPMALGEGPSLNAARVDNDQQAWIEAVREAAMLAGLAGQPQRASDFSIDQQALRSVPMSPGLAAARLTNTRSAIPVSSQGGVYDVVSGAIADVMPQRPPQARTALPDNLTPNAALQFIGSRDFEEAEPWLREALMRVVSNSIPQVATSTVTNRPAGSNIKSIKRIQ